MSQSTRSAATSTQAATSADGYALEPSADLMRLLGGMAVAFCAEHISTLDRQPASFVDNDTATWQAMLPSALAAPPSAALDSGDEATAARLQTLLDSLACYTHFSLNSAGPGYLAYIPGGGMFASALGDFLACCINRYVSMWSAAPLLAAMEQSLLDWLAGLFGRESGAGCGVFTSGGSMASFSAIVTARTFQLGEDFGESARMYVSEQAHSCIAKAARLAGLRTAQIVAIPVLAGDYRMDTVALEARLAADRAAGLRPFLIVATAGATNTGRVDDLAGIAALARRSGVWLHVDAAYGGGFQLTARGRQRLAGIGEADSIALDPHKSLFCPYGLGALLVRNRHALLAAHSTMAEYLQDLGQGLDGPGGALANFSDISPELSRDFRGLRLWLPLHLHGVAAFERALDEILDHAAYAHMRLVAECPGLVLPAGPPDLSVIAFRLAGPPGADQEAVNDLNRRLLAAINGEQRCLLSSTVLDGFFVLRIAIVCHRTHRDLVVHLVDRIVALAQTL